MCLVVCDSRNATAVDISEIRSNQRHLVPLTHRQKNGSREVSQVECVEMNKSMAGKRKGKRAVLMEIW
jgi:hypothetical protein